MSGAKIGRTNLSSRTQTQLFAAVDGLHHRYASLDRKVGFGYEAR